MVLAEDDLLKPLTETGAFHIDRLRLNRPALVERRRERRVLEECTTAQRDMLEKLLQLESRIDSLQDRIAMINP